MKAQLLVGPAPIIGSHGLSSPSLSSPHSGWAHNRAGKSRSRWFFPVVSSSRHPSDGEQNHYSVLGIARNATSADIKRAFRLLARKYHPDVCKDSRSSEVFKSVHRAYEEFMQLLKCSVISVEFKVVLDPSNHLAFSVSRTQNIVMSLIALSVIWSFGPKAVGEILFSMLWSFPHNVLSNEITRVKYDRKLRFQDDSMRSYRKKWNYNSEDEDGARIYRWSELRRKMQQERYQQRYNMNQEEYSSVNDTDDEAGGQTSDQERGSFIEVLGSTFMSLFLFKTLGARFSLTFSSIRALFDQRLDGGYKVGYLIAWILGGSGGIMLTLCLSFASWACGKASSSIVALVVVAMWIASNLARVAPLPQGALITLLYLSIKLQVDLHK